jgi:cytochrome c-type biogenesis protein CcmH/NrfG
MRCLRTCFCDVLLHAQAYDAAWAAIGHAPDNAKAWVRFGEACRAAGRWQLAQLAYCTAMDKLGLQDTAALVSRRAGHVEL